jgi:tRNA(Ile)-lysidine synthase
MNSWENTDPKPTGGHPWALPEEVARFLATLPAACGPGVVAVSGGPDSVALLRALLAVRGDAPLVVAHLNHQLRGPDSDADEAFVAALHARLVADGAALTVRSERIDVAARARQEGDNLENVARRVRYGWLSEVARAAGAGWVATGHTADDQAETVLHRLLRGTGLKGLAGIPARRELTPGVEVVRPLLGVTRAAVLAYLRAIGQDFRLDASNADLRFTRNRIRHELLPHLARQYNPAVVAVLGRLAEQAAEVQGREEAAARALLAEAELPRAGQVLVLNPARLSVASRNVVREAFRQLWQREGWPAGGASFDTWERAAAVALGEAPAVDLPGRVRVRRKGRVVQVVPVRADRRARDDRKGPERQP